ncbi:MAG TPA: hypothetical protein ENJ95_17310 [Bacteroidetes bacterium]|nr:hypothetical protein [Bacteroidota bacterium]
MSATNINPIEKKQRTIVQKGFDLLARENNYTQVVVVNKIKQLHFEVSRASLSNILNGKRAGSDALWNASRGIKQLVLQELGYEHDGKDFIKNNTPDWKPVIVPEYQEAGAAPKLNYIFHQKGRLRTEQKTAFFSTAQTELIEFGLSLNSFSNYFFTRNEEEYKAHIESLLKKGVHIKCYLLDPECNEARLYFNDRKIFVEEDCPGTEKIKTVLRRFKKIDREFKAAGHRGRFEIYTYKHIPNNYFLSVDGNSLNGKMMVSHYIYGELRANCPVLEFTKKDNPSLFKKYWNSLDKLMQGANKIKFD